MPEVEYLTTTDVLALADRFFEALGYARPVLKGDGWSLLDSAVHRPQTAAYYGDADLALQAAVLCNGIALNHAFVDGNKRAAWIACVTFLSINGHDLVDEAALDELASYIIRLHEDTDHSKADAELADWLRNTLNLPAV